MNMMTIQISGPSKTTLVIIILSCWFDQFHSVCKMMSTPKIAWKIPNKTLIALHNWWLIIAILTFLSIIRERCLYHGVGRCCDGFMSALWPLESGARESLSAHYSYTVHQCKHMEFWHLWNSASESGISSKKLN